MGNYYIYRNTTNSIIDFKIKNMKNILYFILILSSLAFSQNKTIQIIRNDSLGSIEYNYITKFIKIEVNDSIQLEHTNYDILISINQYPYTYTEKDSVEYDFGFVRADLYKMNKSKLENFLKSKKYKFEHYNFTSELKNNIPSYLDNYLLNISSDSKSYRNLINDLERFDFIKYEISNIYYKDEDRIEEILFERLIKNANKKASMVAKMSNLKLGKIIQIDENTTNYINKFGSQYHNNFFRVRSIIVKFSIEE